MKYYVYIIRTVNNKLYTGIALDVQKRFLMHCKGRGAKFTRANKPEKIVYISEFETKSLALIEECRIKKLKREKKLELIKKFNLDKNLDT